MKKNTTSAFTTTILVDKTPDEAFNAINNVPEWWTGEPGVEGSTDKLGDEFTYRYKDLHYSKQKITELIPGKKIVWLITDSKLNFIKDKSEWTGTRISFEISEKNNKTQIRFTHVGLVPGIECYSDCSNAWGQYIQQSLLKLITTGKYQPDKKEDIKEQITIK
jgi:Activator of Hsp90 ATPase homolog 1-like protein